MMQPPVGRRGNHSCYLVKSGGEEGSYQRQHVLV